MNNDELEKTKPIQTLKDINTDESNGSRASKYKDVLDEERRKLDEEAAEEALAEKNIAQAEAILAADAALLSAGDGERRARWRRCSS